MTRASELENEAMRALLIQSYSQRMEYIGVYAWDMGYRNRIWDMSKGCILLELGSTQERHRHQTGTRNQLNAWLKGVGADAVMNFILPHARD